MGVGYGIVAERCKTSPEVSIAGAILGGGLPCPTSRRGRQRKFQSRGRFLGVGYLAVDVQIVPQPKVSIAGAILGGGLP